MVGDSDLSKTREPGGPADDDENLDKQWKVILGALIYEGRRYIPADALLRNKVICLFHDNPESDHFGALRTAELVSRDFYWHPIDATIRKFIAGCEVCHRIKAPCHACHGVNMPLLLPSIPWQEITMDFVMDLPESTASGYTGIAVIVNRLTKMEIYLPFQKDIDSPELARMIFKHVICKHGIRDNIITDHRPQFTSQFWD